MTERLKDYAVKKTYKGRGINRIAQKTCSYGYDVQFVQPYVAPGHKQQGVVPHDTDEFESIKVVAFAAAAGGMIDLDSEQYGLVSHVFSNRLVVTPSVIDEVIDDGAINLNWLGARIQNAKHIASSVFPHRGLKILPVDSFRPNRVDVKNDHKELLPTSQDCAVYTITACLSGYSADGVEMDWQGGDKLSVNRQRMFGDWARVKTGCWFKAVILRRPSGEVIAAIFQDMVPPPRYMSAAELAEAYSKIKPAELSPME